MQSEDILHDLVSFRSVAGASNTEIADWLTAFLVARGARVTAVPGPEGDRRNLFASLGPADGQGIVLSAHMDVVPAGEADWISDPFVLRQDGERLYGRGASDMKGFLATTLSLVDTLRECRLARPLHLALTYDEEIGCSGAPHLVALLPELCAAPICCIVGEPTELHPVDAHKGKIAIRFDVHGRSGHSARPDLALNAIHGMSEILSSAAFTAQALSQDEIDPAFDPGYSTLQVGVIHGGRAVNIVPELCSAEIEIRAIPTMDPEALFKPVLRSADRLVEHGYRVTRTVASRYPAFQLPADSHLIGLLEEASGRPCRGAVSFGTEAGLFQKIGWQTIVCGPGDMARAHRANEYITIGELAECRSMLDTLVEQHLL